MTKAYKGKCLLWDPWFRWVREYVHHDGAGQQGGRHGAGAAAESTHLDLQAGSRDS